MTGRLLLLTAAVTLPNGLNHEKRSPGSRGGMRNIVRSCSCCVYIIDVYFNIISLSRGPPWPHHLRRPPLLVFIFVNYSNECGCGSYIQSVYAHTHSLTNTHSRTHAHTISSDVSDRY